MSLSNVSFLIKPEEVVTRIAAPAQSRFGSNPVIARRSKPSAAPPEAAEHQTGAGGRRLLTDDLWWSNIALWAIAHSRGA